MTEVGTRVLAIRDGADNVLNIFGEGVYVGDLPRPGVLSDEMRQMLEKHIQAEDEVPVEKHWQVDMYDHFLEQGVEPSTGKSREDIIAGVEAERAQSMDERVADWFALMQRNPCIHLDSGDIVWGCQCWWGPLDQAMEKYKNCTINTVPVPEGNGRWK